MPNTCQHGILPVFGGFSRGRSVLSLPQRVNTRDRYFCTIGQCLIVRDTSTTSSIRGGHDCLAYLFKTYGPSERMAKLTPNTTGASIALVCSRQHSDPSKKGVQTIKI